MKKRTLILCAFVLVVGYLYASRVHSAWAQQQYKPVAVVELFTSEGCSSCPPADRILSELTRASRTKNPQIFTLAFHVDYWDYLGWKDRFSNQKFSERQRVYAKTLKEYQVYTPQMIVNGLVSFGGYRKDLAEESINRMLQQPAKSNIELSVKPGSTPENLTVAFNVAGAGAGQLLHVAVVERGLANDIKSGENGGKVLHHDNVVRVFKTLPLRNPAGEIHIRIPDSVDHTNASLISYVQNPKTAQVLGASRLDL